MRRRSGVREFSIFFHWRKLPSFQQGCLHPLLLGELGKINGWDFSLWDASTDEGSLNRFYSKGPFLENILCDASNKSDRCLSKLEYAWLNSCCHPPLTFIYSRGLFFLILLSAFLWFIRQVPRTFWKDCWVSFFNLILCFVLEK